ncbi:MAG TPA: isoleucine--tRNA ligase [Candidatus Acidoferrales bacterium]|nr:isoleucine--tRNA ligase [Candidatus Acidoferrales bacterium]
MIKFKEVSDKIKYSDLEREILEFWRNNKIFEKSVAEREGKPGFTFYEGPPTANGRPGIHHVLARTLKDLVCRYKTMRGYQVHRKAGWDTHGLPVEIEVEKKLGIKHKDEIVSYGVEKFNELCRKSVFEYKDDWEKMTEQIGYWVDLNDAYITCDNNYIESVWWALKKFFDAGMIYKGHKIQPYCPRCETPLSSHEVALGYEDVKDPSVYVKMKLRDAENTFFLVWTTTPWTLISNVALAVGSDIDYVKVEHKGEILILARARLSVLDGDYSIIEEMKGSKLIGKEYERIFDYIPVNKKGFYVIHGDFVSTEDGSGIVHIAPAFGEDDYNAGREHDLPVLQPVDRSGNFTKDVTDFAGKFVKDADLEIIANLKRRNILYKKETITHSYPHCWRCKTPLLYYARASWYIATTKFAAKMVDLNKQINWVPPEVGIGRFGNWLEENKDWALSRDRFWGTPLNIWVCQNEKCGHLQSVGSVEELKKADRYNLAVALALKNDELDLHKPFVDAIVLTCEKCGGEMKRTPELIDVWFDSGSMPFAQYHYPFDNEDWLEKHFPADYISEGIDQTRGWFYSMHAIATFLFDSPAYKSVISHELILDKDGQKMSKSKGNVVDPFKVVEDYGADTVRWYLIASSPPHKPKLFDESGLVEVQRKFFSTLLNTYAFFTLYANIDGFTYSEPRIPVSERLEIDRWIVSVMNSLVKDYSTSMDAYDVMKAARAVSDFTIDQLSNWYVRRSRRRFWKGDMAKDKLSAYQTLYECLVTVVKSMSPFAPFLSEELYRNLNGVTSLEPHESVHLSRFPEVNESEIDSQLEERMALAQKIVYLARAMRAKSNIRVRQPLKRIIVPVSSNHVRETISQVESVILDEINVKSIMYVDDDSEFISKGAKPNFKSIGPKFGKDVKVVAELIKSMNSKDIRALEKAGSIDLHVDSKAFHVVREDVEIFSQELSGLLVESDGGLTVALDTELDEGLKREGIAREFVNRIQNLRKDAGFEVTDRISVNVDCPAEFTDAVEKLSDYIKSETLAVDLSTEFQEGEYSEDVEIEKQKFKISLSRVKNAANH